MEKRKHSKNADGPNRLRKTPLCAACEPAVETKVSLPLLDESTPNESNTKRSESLLPASTDDSDEDNASFDVAEEVSLDQQSDRVRQIGNLPADGEKTPAGSASTAIAKTLSQEPDDDPADAERTAARKQGD